MLPLFLGMDFIKLRKQFWTNLKCSACVPVFGFYQKLNSSLWSEKKYFFISYSTLKNWQLFISRCNLDFCRQYRENFWHYKILSYPVELFLHFSSVLSEKVDWERFFLRYFSVRCGVFLGVFELLFWSFIWNYLYVYVWACLRSLTCSMNSPVGDILVVTLHWLYFLCKIHFRYNLVC